MRLIKYGKDSPHWLGGKKDRTCLSCGKHFLVDPNVIKRGFGKFCSRSCLGKRTYGKKIKAARLQFKCLVCGKTFERYASDCLREPNRGKCCGNSCRVIYTKMKISGSQNYRWLGGKTKQNTLERSQMETRKWSFAVKKRDGFKCMACGDRTFKGRGKTMQLHAHHIKPWKDFPELKHSLENGITLCIPCHTKVHGRKK